MQHSCYLEQTEHACMYIPDFSEKIKQTRQKAHNKRQAVCSARIPPPRPTPSAFSRPHPLHAHFPTPTWRPCAPRRAATRPFRREGANLPPVLARRSLLE
jgi:hypothetical protein